VFCRKSETLEIARRRLRRTSKELAFGVVKTENASLRCHARHVLEAATCQHLIRGQQGGVLM
jgi:hypothetical protein